jgi:hypothetical protein
LESSSCFLPFAGVDPCDELIQLAPSSCGGGFLVNGVGRMIGSMWWRTAEEAIHRRTPRAKGAPNRARSGLGRSAQAHFGPVRPQFPPRLLLALACGPLTSFPSWLRLESFLSKLRHFQVESLNTCTLTLQSSGHLESCSSRVLTCDGLHDLLLKCLMNLSRKSPL